MVDMDGEEELIVQPQPQLEQKLMVILQSKAEEFSSLNRNDNSGREPKVPRTTLKWRAFFILKG